ncbi:MAG: DUF1854 domain-containing protein [Clostridiales bacterium]|nr:DUF1854 domain-containing protein [Clostridiales bacterium]
MEHNDILEQEQQAVEQLIAIHPLTADNAVFCRTGGGFVSLTYTSPDGEVKQYPRVAVHRCFPFSDPDHYVSIREPEAGGKEIGLVEDLAALPPHTQELLNEQLALRYFVPRIEKIRSIREEYGYSYWEVTTDHGACRFTVRMGGGSVYSVGGSRYMINDIDGNRFEIPDLYRLTAREIRELDPFI